MGYLANGSEYLAFDQVYCQHCVHCPPADGPDCPVLTLHRLWNYEQYDDERQSAERRELAGAKRLALDVLVTSEPGKAPVCHLFRPQAEPEPEIDWRDALWDTTHAGVAR